MILMGPFSRNLETHREQQRMLMSRDEQFPALRYSGTPQVSNVKIGGGAFILCFLTIQVYSIVIFIIFLLFFES